MKPKVTIISSFSNPKRVLREVKRLEETYEVEVILPTPEWMERMSRLMGSTSGHFEDKHKCVLKRIHIETYLRAIRDADFVHIFNVKCVKNLNDVPENQRNHSLTPTDLGYEYEYYGLNTMLEIGYAHALGKTLTSYIPPTEPELKNMVSMQV